MVDVDSLLIDVKDKFWRDKIKKSVRAIFDLYGLNLNEISITKQKVNPNELFIAAVEECNLDVAKKYLKQYRKPPPPITVIQHKDKKVLFMGSNRVAQFVLLRKFPDCIVLKIPDATRSELIEEATLTLKEVLDRQRK